MCLDLKITLICFRIVFPRSYFKPRHVLFSKERRKRGRKKEIIFLVTNVMEINEVLIYLEKKLNSKFSILS